MMQLTAVVQERSSEVDVGRARSPAISVRERFAPSRFWFKACPRCGGDLVSETDMHEPYVACMQCGHYLTTD